MALSLCLDVFVLAIVLVPCSTERYVLCQNEQKTGNRSFDTGLYRDIRECPLFYGIKNVCVPSVFFQWRWTCCSDNDKGVTSTAFSEDVKSISERWSLEDLPSCSWIHTHSKIICSHEQGCKLRVSVNMTLHGGVDTFWTDLMKAVHTSTTQTITTHMPDVYTEATQIRERSAEVKHAAIQPTQQFKAVPDRAEHTTIQPTEKIKVATEQSKVVPVTSKPMPKVVPTEETKEKTVRSVSIGTMCTDGSTCNEARSVCFHGHCLCEPGLALEDGRCVQHCKKHGSTFTLYKGIAIKHHNDKKTTLNIHVVEDCIRMCAQETTFLCLSFEFKRSYVIECRISKSGYLDVPKWERQTGKSYITFGTRNCAK